MPVTCLPVSESSSAEKEKGPREMKSLLFALGLALCCFAQAEWKEVTTTSEKDMGHWITIAIACNSTESLEQIKNLNAFAAVLSKPEENVIRVRASIHMPDRCTNVTYDFQKREDGKFHGVSDDTDVKVESVKVRDGFIMSSVNVNNESRVATFHGRSVTQDPGILQEFKEECKRLGFTENQIVILNPKVMCPLE